MHQLFSKVFLSVPAVIFLVSPLFSSAASLYIDPPTNTLYRGDAVTLSVRLDTDESVGECVNAVDAVIKYSENIEPVDISTGNSIFNIWVETPTINRQERIITFAGGIPNGYCGRVEGDPRLTNILTQIIFRSPSFSVSGSNDTDASVYFSDESTAYLNDGLGTRVSLNTYPAKIILNKTASTTFTNPWQAEIDADKTPPNEFSIDLQRDDNAFYKKYYIVFNTTDKETGIDHYEIMEEPLNQIGDFQWGRVDAPWVIARSPYVLEDQTLNSIIRVKAVDKAGNQYISNLIPDESMRTMSVSQVAFSVTFLVIFGAFAFMLISLAFLILKKRKINIFKKAEGATEESDFGLQVGEEESLTNENTHENK